MNSRIKSIAKRLHQTGTKLARGLAHGARIARKRQLTRTQMRRAKKGRYDWRNGLLRDNRSVTTWKVNREGKIVKKMTTFGGTRGLTHPVSWTVTTYDPNGKRIGHKTQQFTRRRQKPK